MRKALVSWPLKMMIMIGILLQGPEEKGRRYIVEIQ
jgi:hypothetical protein